MRNNNNNNTVAAPPFIPYLIAFFSVQIVFEPMPWYATALFFVGTVAFWEGHWAWRVKSKKAELATLKAAELQKTVEVLSQKTIDPEYANFMKRVAFRLDALVAKLKADGIKGEYGEVKLGLRHTRDASQKSFYEGGLFVEFLPEPVATNQFDYIEAYDPSFFLNDFDSVYAVFKQSYIEAAMGQQLTGGTGDFDVVDDDDDEEGDDTMGTTAGK